MQISILLGTIFGVVLNHVLPEIVLLVYVQTSSPRHPAAASRLTEWRFRRAVRWVLSWASPASPVSARAWRRGRGTTSWWVTDHRSARPFQDLHTPFGLQAYAAMDDGAGADGASAGDEDSVEAETEFSNIS